MISNIERTRSALAFIPANDRDLWVSMAFAVKTEHGDAGFPIWNEWSQQAENYDPKAADDTWRSADEIGPVKLGTLIRAAKERGWQDNGVFQKPTQDEIDEQQRIKAERAAQSAAKRAKISKVTADKATAIAKASTKAEDDNPYLELKGVPATETLLEIEAVTVFEILGYQPKSKDVPLTGRLLIAPIKQNGKLSSLELIDGSGRKAALAGRGTKTGGYWTTQKLPDEDGPEPLQIFEGVATTLSGWCATGAPSVAALSSSNLMTIAKIMRERYPTRPIVIGADLVSKTGMPDPHAIAAAEAINGLLAVPDFGDSHSESVSDFNDLLQLLGMDDVERCLRNAVLQKKEQTKKFSNNFKSSQSSQSSLPEDEVLTEPSQAFTDSSRIGQNEMATLVADGLRAHAGYDTKSFCWHIKMQDIWEPIPEKKIRSIAEREVTKHKAAFSAGYLSGVMQFLESRLALPEWSANRNLMPFLNGVLDLDSGTLLKYGEAHVFNWQIPHEHDATAECPTILQWLKTTTRHDEEITGFLMAWMRFVLTGGAHLQKYLEMIGNGGTGKSTFTRLCALLVGQANMVSTDLKTLETSRFESANLYGKRLAVIADSARYGGDVAMLKAITGGDPIRFEQKNIQAGASFVFQGLVMIAANEPIQSADYTSGLARRRIPVYLTRKITESEKLAAPDFEKRLEREIPGLINILLKLNVKTCEDIIRNPGVNMATAKLEAELDTNPLLTWMHERLIVCDKRQETAIGTAKTNGLYADYIIHCDEHGREPLSLTRFSGLVVDNAVSRDIVTEKKRESGSGKNILTNIRLRDVSDNNIERLFSLAISAISVKAVKDVVKTSSLGSDDSVDCEGFLSPTTFTAEALQPEVESEVVF
jgi:P4 family phage/plasmid primase-like protien